MPLGRNVGKNMAELTDKHPNWTYKHRLGASYNAAREHGAHIPKSTKVSKTSYKKNQGRRGVRRRTRKS